MADRPWSYSALSGYELCPKKWAAQAIHKTTKYTEGPQQAYGKEVHNFLDNRVKKARPLPMDLAHHEGLVAKLAARPGTKLTEVHIGITKELQQCDYWASDIWCRGVIDFITYDADSAVIVDWKTGKVRPDFDQLDLMTALTMVILPTIKKAAGMFYWTKEKEITSKLYTRAELPGLWENFLPRVQRFQQAIEANDFPARQNFLCARHCEVRGCQFNGSAHS